MVSDKLGLPDPDPQGDSSLIEDLFATLQVAEIDMTVFFRRLAQLPARGAPEEAGAALAPLGEAFYDPHAFAGDARRAVEGWVERYHQRVRATRITDAERRDRMDSVNPHYVLRNYLAQLAIDKATAGDFSMVHELLDVLRNPYEEQPGKERYAARRPEWARNRPGCSTLSCSS